MGIERDPNATTETLPFDPEATFMERIMKAEKAAETAAETPSEQEHEEEEHEEESHEEEASHEEESDESPDESDEEETEGEDESEKEEKPKEQSKKTRVVLEADADAVVKHKVDGKDIEIPVKDLTRLYGQEASLTRKSQELADARKNTDTQVQKYVAGVETLLQRAQKEYEPYSKINFLALAKDPNISGDDLSALQEQATKAYQNVQYLQGELDNTLKQHQETRHQRLVEEATKGWQILSDPKTGIEGWGEPMYQDIRSYALTSGINKQVMDEMVDPMAFKIIYKAMMFDKGQKASVTTKKVDKSPKKIIKSSTEPVTTKSKPKNAELAMSKLRKSGSVDDATEVFLARMSRSSE